MTYYGVVMGKFMYVVTYLGECDHRPGMDW
jgi:hypothetical protein